MSGQRGQLKRRDFLKCSLAAGVVGLGSAGALTTLGACSFFPPGAAAGAGSQVAGEALTAGHWGMVIDVARFNEQADFAKIVSACHTNHNVPLIDDPKIEVKWIWEEDFEHSFGELNNEYLPAQIKDSDFPVLCNHCENPACVRVCPTEATFKRPDGIVNMDYHRCIGCRFCMTACPFNARSLNFFEPRLYLSEINPDYPTRTLGVVEKCNFCVERLEQGLAPYCVEASNGTILFGDLDDPNSEVRRALDESFSIRRLTELGTGPSVYYLIGEGDSHA